MASVWYIGSSAVARFIGALGTPIFTRLLTPEEYGLYPLYNTWLGVLSVVITLEITGAAIYRGIQRHKENIDTFISSALGLILSVFLLFCLLYFTFSPFFNSITGLSTSVTFMMMLQISASAIISLYTARARFEYRCKAVAALNLSSALIIPLISVLLILTTQYRAAARIIASSLTIFFTALPICVIILRKSWRLYSKEIWAYLLRVSVPLLPHYFGTALILKIGEIMISRTSGQVALGRYSVALSLGMSLTIVTSGLMSALSPWIIRKMKAGITAEIRDMLLLCIKVLCILCLGLLAVAPEAMAILSSEGFRSSLPAVYPLALSVIPAFLSSALMSGGVYFEKNGRSALPSLIAATVSSLLSILLLPYVDYRYVSVFVLISYVTLAAFNILTLKRLAHEAPIHLHATLSIFLLTVGYAALLFALRDVLISRFLLALPLLPALLYVGRDVYGKIKE